MSDKRILKYISACILVLVLLPSIYKAQKDTARFFLSIRAGFGVSFTQDIDYLGNKGFGPTNLVSWLGGLSGVYKINNYFLIGADVHFNQRGTNYQKANDSLIYVTTNQSGVIQKTEKVYFFTQNIIYAVEVPVYLTIGSFNKRYSPFIKIGINSSLTLKHIQREYTWIGTTENKNDLKTTGMAGRYYPGILLATGFKIKRLLLQVSYTTYPNTKIVYYNFTGKASPYTLLFSLAFIIKKNKKPKANPYMQFNYPPRR